MESSGGSIRLCADRQKQDENSPDKTTQRKLQWRREERTTPSRMKVEKQRSVRRSGRDQRNSRERRPTALRKEKGDSAASTAPIPSYHLPKRLRRAGLGVETCQ